MDEEKKEQSKHSTIHCQPKHKKREEERESTRKKIELNSLILNYYLSIMGGMEPGCCVGEG